MKLKFNLAIRLGFFAGLAIGLGAARLWRRSRQGG
jgi:hypothetical protein